MKKVSDSTQAAPDEVLSTEREKTDESLRHERDKADKALSAREAELARLAEGTVDLARTTADAVLSVARDNADAVVDAAREKADEQQAARSNHLDRAALDKERSVADEALRAERDSADDILREEREEHVRTTQRFVPLEREFTDRSLRSERIRADQAVVNRDDFLAIVAHDLRDLLFGIKLSSQVVAKRAKQDEAGAGTLVEMARIERNAARMGRLIGDLVDIASIDAGKLAVAPIPGDLAVVIAEAVDTFQTAAASQGITLESQVDAAPLNALFDRSRIHQVLGNLVSNALKYTPRGGKITLVGERVDNGMQVTVKDTGDGIPEEALESIFERFTQVGAHEHGGLGLGLYTSRCLVQAHGGTIRAESKSGAGTRMCMILPAHSPGAGLLVTADASDTSRSP